MTLSRAMQLRSIGSPLVHVQRPLPVPGDGQVRVRIEACAVCRTDLHVVDGELPDTRTPIVPGHEIVGCVEALGNGVHEDMLGRRVGTPWLAWACGECTYCREGRENLCDDVEFTGYSRDGGYADHCVADAEFLLPLPQGSDPVSTAPLLCAGLIGYRALSFALPARRIGIYGFGAAAHIVAQIIVHEGREFYAFVRPGDEAAERFALELGAIWSGPSDSMPPAELDAALIFAPVGSLVPQALKAVRKGGRVVCGGIHMSDIPTFPYTDLWHERSIVSVANLTRRDGREFFPTAAAAGVRTETSVYRLENANVALDDLRSGKLRGAAVLVP